MNCIVTAGPTFEPLDDVRRLTNFSTGRLGTELANFLTAHGHKVTLLIGESATYSGECRARSVKVFSTTADLCAKLKSFSSKKVDAIFHAAAVSDFTFGKMFTRDAAGILKSFTPSKKISTRGGKLFVELVPTPKSSRNCAAGFRGRKSWAGNSRRTASGRMRCGRPKSNSRIARRMPVWRMVRPTVKAST